MQFFEGNLLNMLNTFLSKLFTQGYMFYDAWIGTFLAVYFYTLKLKPVKKKSGYI